MDTCHDCNAAPATRRVGLMQMCQACYDQFELDAREFFQYDLETGHYELMQRLEAEELGL